MKLQELIRQYPELGDALAEFENRISFLENSLPYYQEEYKSEIQPVFKPRPVDKEIDQLKANYIGLRNKLYEHLGSSKNKDRL